LDVEALERFFARLDRSQFLDGAYKASTCCDMPLPIGWGQTMQAASGVSLTLAHPSRDVGKWKWIDQLLHLRCLSNHNIGNDLLQQKSNVWYTYTNIQRR
jgi:hypothetical protein